MSGEYDKKKFKTSHKTSVADFATAVEYEKKS